MAGNMEKGKWVLTGSGILAGVILCFIIFYGKTAGNERRVSPGIKCVKTNIAMRYAHALQEGNAEEVIRLTAWMQERLDYVRITQGTQEALLQARKELIRKITERKIEENKLTAEGVEDKYLFAPGTQLELVSEDEGRDDLAFRVKKRYWIRITYPFRERALMNMDGHPIRSLVVGLNISDKDKILKAGIRGNTDIDYESIVVY